jgi:hypothetical protein
MSRAAGHGETSATGQAGWVCDGLDPDEVHALLCASDLVAATATGTPVPVRDMAVTRQRLGEGAVHVLRHGPVAVATFTLTATPPHGVAADAFSPARSPAYLQRLAILPGRPEESWLVGVQAVRRAVEVARAGGADVLCSQANPDLTQVREMLRMLGFVRRGEVVTDGATRRCHLEKRLGPTPR